MAPQVIGFQNSAMILSKSWKSMQAAPLHEIPLARGDLGQGVDDW